MRLKTKPKTYNIVAFLIIFVFILTFTMMHFFNKKISPKMLGIIETRINKLSNDIIMDSFNNKLLEHYDFNNIIIVSKNKNDEIIAVDFDLNHAYELSLAITKSIKDTLKSLENEYFEQSDILKKTNEREYVLLVPVGLASNNIFFANIGPKIPVKVTYINNIVTGLSTNVKNYGINNALIELYININMSEEVLIPYADKKINNSIKILISSQIVEGVVPDLYNGILSNNSSLINVPLEQ